MRLSIFGQSFQLTDAIVRHVEGRIQLALGMASGHISAVSVRLADINGGRGGADKRCRLVIRLHNHRIIVIEAVQADLYAAIDEAADRARGTVWRLIKRQRTLRREYASRSAGRLLA